MSQIRPSVESLCIYHAQLFVFVFCASEVPPAVKGRIHYNRNEPFRFTKYLMDA